MRRCKSQRVRQSNSEQANAILNRRRHVENRAGQRSIFGDAAAVACSDVLSVEGEMGMTAADGRHGVTHEHGVAEPAQRKAEHGGIDVHTVDDEPIPAFGRFQCQRDRAGLTTGQRTHGVEEVREADESLGHGGTRLRVSCH